MYPNQKRKKYPSQIKYEQNNPTITFRMKKHEKNKIRQMAEKSEKSVSKLVRIALLKLEEDFSEAIDKVSSEEYYRGFDDGKCEGYKEGEKKGYTKGMNDWAIWCYCYNCWKAIFIKPNSEDHMKVIEEMKGRLKHDQCPE